MCKSPEKPSEDNRMVCMHMDMTGVAFGHQALGYKLRIGPSGKVDSITADFFGKIEMPEYFAPKI